MVKTKQKLDYINGIYGPKNQVRVYILVYKNQPYSIVNKQLCYWQGGNKNELLIHIGINQAHKILWYDATSWMDKPEATAQIKSFLSTQDKLNTDALVDQLPGIIEQHWHRKSFSDFDYLEIELTGTQISWLIILLLCVNVGIGIWVIKNNF